MKRKKRTERKNRMKERFYIKEGIFRVTGAHCYKNRMKGKKCFYCLQLIPLFEETNMNFYGQIGILNYNAIYCFSRT